MITEPRRRPMGHRYRAVELLDSCKQTGHSSCA